MKLNEKQEEAATCLDQSVFVEAGPGSGKTRILIQRIANLIRNGVSPTEILAFTFTRNAAREMQERLAKEVGEAEAKRMWITTIHGFCARVLHTWGWKVDLKEGFTVYDDRDQLDIIIDVQKDLGIKTKPNTLLKEINRGRVDPRRAIAAQEVALRLRENNATNFVGMLQKTIYVLVNCSDALEYYTNRFRYVHLDEMNDTSDHDYSIVKMIAAKWNNLFACGDLDQCIYTFRGSKAENVAHLKQEFPHKNVKVNLSYRCTKPIVEACNTLIAHNGSNKGLVSEKDGPPIAVAQYSSEDDEARGIKDVIVDAASKGRPYSDMAVLCRTHSVEAGIISALEVANVPVSIAGSTMQFLDLEEVRLFHSYLKTITNLTDRLSFKRVMAEPPKGIRASAVAQMDAIARQGDITLLEAALIHFQDEEPEKRQWLVDLNVLSRQPFAEQCRNIYDKLTTWYSAGGRTTRCESLSLLLKFTAEWQSNTPDEITTRNYLAYITEVNAQQDVTDDTDSVKVMTVHTAKGLEFPLVIMPGCENLIFPLNNMADTEEKKKSVQEDRRLFYVGMSRSSEKLILTSSSRRIYRGKDRTMYPSIFIEEAGLVMQGAAT